MGIAHREFTHAGPVKSLQQAASERGQLPEQVVRSILFRLDDGDYILVVIAGPAQIPWPALRKYIGKSRMSLAKPDEVKRVTGFVVGSVSPFGLPSPMRILLDKSVLKQNEVSIGSGVRGTTIFIKVTDLAKAIGDTEIVDFLG
jgi:Cys-tRNA(Pro) deacylase